MANIHGLAKKKEEKDVKDMKDMEELSQRGGGSSSTSVLRPTRTL